MKLAYPTIGFYDKEAETFRTLGARFEVSDERAEYLAKLGLVRMKDAPPKKKRKTSKK